MQEQERWQSVEEIAAHLGVNRDTLYKWIERKQMPAHKLGKLWKFKATEVDEWVRQCNSSNDHADDVGSHEPPSTQKERQ
jgi:excisionase family DNA binding protein